MKIFDLHQDLMTHIRFRDEMGQYKQTDFSMLEGSEVDLVVATAFPLPKNDYHLSPGVNALITEELQMYKDFVALSDRWALVKNSADFMSGRKKLILHLEGLNVFDDEEESWQQLDDWVAQGVRSIGTHWNIDNQLGAGTLNENGGLTELGLEVIKYLEKNKIVFDLAHIGRGAFFDAAEAVNRPLYVSHGNVDALCPNIRNYTDEQLNIIAKSGGVIGVFFANTFVVGKDKVGSIENLVEHIDYLKNLIGIEHIALGSDFGGIISGSLTGLSSVEDYSNLEKILKNNGYSEDEVSLIFSKNAERVLQDHLS